MIFHEPTTYNIFENMFGLWNSALTNINKSITSKSHGHWGNEFYKNYKKNWHLNCPQVNKNIGFIIYIYDSVKPIRGNKQWLHIFD